jgi:hypothetical protein
MALAVSASLETPRMNARLDVTGVPAGAATYTITRESPSGNTAAVRGAVNAPTHGASEIIARDYEIPLDTPLVYTVTTYDSAGNTLEVAVDDFTAAWGECQAWLCDLARPTNSLALTIESLNQLTFDFATGLHRVLDRRAPVLTSLPAWTPSGELDVLTDTLVERDQVRTLLGNAYPFLLRTSPDMGIGNLFLGVTQFIEERFLTLGVAPERRFRVQVVQVERPDPGLFVPMPPNTYQNVKDTFATYADLKAAVGTYDQLAYTWPDNPQASPIDPWLPDDI